MESIEAQSRRPPDFPRPSPLVQGAFRALGTAWPSGAERLSAWLFCHPPKAGETAAEREVMERGHPFTLQIQGFRLAGRRWGEGPRVLLHHGWGGRASHMSAFVDPLVEAGYTVLAYDAPAHGASSGRTTCGPQISWILSEAADRLGGLEAVIGHSIGAAAALMSLGQGMEVGRAVLLAPPAEFRSFIRLFGDLLGLDEVGRRGMAQRAAQWFGLSWSEMDVEHWRNGSEVPLLLFQDSEDEVVPLEDARRIQRAWPHCTLVTTEGLGHRGLRSDPWVVARAVDFLAQS